MRTRIFRLALLILLVLAVQASYLLPAAAADTAQVRETVLPNGLKVLTKEVHAAPVVSFMVWYKVGSRNEQLGKTGLSHFLEHMQFKGTETLKKGEIDSLIRRNGGISNAATWKDFTYYYETLSSDKLELAMRIESDRMVNSLIDPEEFKAEMTVVRSELEGKENNPDQLIYYELYATAFKAHPYQWPTIGWLNDVETLTRDDLYSYYRTYYHPNNATVVIVGDFKTEKALEMVKQYFGDIPRGPVPPEVRAVEPEQLGEKRALVKRPGVAHRVMMGWHTPGIGHSDIYPLDVLEIVLGTGTSSRLYKGLVDGQLATGAWAGASINKDPDLFIMGGTARDGVAIEDVEAALLAEVEKLKTEPITDEELQKALNQLEAQFIYSNDSVTSQARMLGEYETKYSWRFLDEYLDNVRKVTKADVQRVAQTYLTDRNRTVVTFVPEETSEASSTTPPQSGAPVEGVGYRDQETVHQPAMAVAGDAVVRINESKPGSEVVPTRVVLDNGITVIIHENRSNPTVAVQGSVNAGSMLDPDGKSGLAQMTAGLLVKGTSKRTADEISLQTDLAAMRLGAWAETEYSGFSGYSLSRDFDSLLDLLSDVLRNPVFPENEFSKMQARRLSGIKEELDRPQSLAQRAFYGGIFPKGHAYHQISVEEELANTSAISREDVLNFHKSHYGPRSVIITVVGDVDTQEALASIRRYFGDWTATGKADPVRIADTPIQTGVTKKVIPMPGKSQVEVFLGYSGGLKRTDPDFYAATVMNFILGGGGALGSRLGDVIRDDMGLVYGVYSTFDATLGAGPWYAYLGTNPQAVDKAVDSLVEQITLMRDKGATEEEVRDAVDFIAGSFPARRLERNSTMAETIHAAEVYGLGVDFIHRYQSLYRAVTVDQVNAAAKKYLHPDKYSLVIAGPYKSDTGP